MKQKIIEYIVRNQKKLAIVSLVILGVFAAFTRIPEVDGQLTGFNLEDTQYYQDGMDIAEEFGATKFIQVNVVPKSGEKALTILNSLRELEIDIVNHIPGTRVQSLQNSERLLKIGEENEESIEEVIARAKGLPLVDQLISKDGKSFLFIVFVDTDAFDLKAFNKKINKPIKGVERINVMSPFHVQAEIASSIERDIGVLSLVIVGFFALLILFAYRSFSALVFSMIMIGVAIFPSILFFNVLDIPLNVITVLVVPVLLVLALADAIHLLTGYRSASHLESHDEKLKYVMGNYIVPSFFTSLTTSIAFLSFLLNDAQNIQNFGLITGVTVMIAFFLTYGIGIYLLRFVKPKKRSNRLIEGTAKHLGKRKLVYSALLGVMFVISLFFLKSLKFDTNIESFIPRGTQLYEDQQELMKQYYSQLRLEVVLKKKDEKHSTKELRETVVALHKKLERQESVGVVHSVKDQIDFKKRLGPVSGFVRFPTTDNPYFTKDKGAFRLDVRLHSAKDLRNVEHFVRSYHKMHSGTYELKVFSNGLLINEVNSRAAKSLLYSLLFSGIFISVLIFALSRSLAVALISVVANILPLSAVVLLFTVLDLDLNLLTAITAVVCVGLIVDDTIHVIYRRVVLKSELSEVSFGIITTSLILFVGFMAFGLSSFVPSQTFGIISAIIFILTVISDLTLLPLLIKIFENRNKSLPSRGD